MDWSDYPLWNVDPVMVRIAGRAIRYYSVGFFLSLVIGYLCFHYQMRRAGHGLIPTSRFALWMFVGIVAGGRLGHCLLYEPDYYLANPVQILDLSRGGISSHGATLSIFLTLLLYAKRYRYSPMEIADRMACSMVGAGLIRVGNFFNSEIVGREWTGPLAIRFERYAAYLQQIWERGMDGLPGHGALGWTAVPLPRHPVQLYEAFGVTTAAIVVVLIDRRLGENRPRGLLAATFCALYFCMRFVAEFAKERLIFSGLAPDETERVIRSIHESGLTQGQKLSLPFIALALYGIVRALVRREPAAVLSRYDEEPAGE